VNIVRQAQRNAEENVTSSFLKRGSRTTRKSPRGLFLMTRSPHKKVTELRSTSVRESWTSPSSSTLKGRDVLHLRRQWDLVQPTSETASIVTKYSAFDFGRLDVQIANREPGTQKLLCCSDVCRSRYCTVHPRTPKPRDLTKKV